MADRKDALVAAARFIDKVPKIVEEYGNSYTVATVGTMKVVPNSVNVIPGECIFNLEIRDQDAEIIELIECKLKECLDQVCKEMEEEYKFERFSYHEPAPMADWVKEAIEASVKGLGIEHAVIPVSYTHLEGMNVFMFSDNVTLEDEIKLKQKAHEKGLAVMGPDCGTGIIQGCLLYTSRCV